MNNGVMLFFTSTILYWQNLLRQKETKQIVIDSLLFLVKTNKIKLYGFVIMPNHIHLLIEVLYPQNKNENVQHSFLSYTSHQFKKFLKENNCKELEKFEVNDSDRAYQFWERNPLSIEIYSREVAEQKLRYIHNNPRQEKWNLISNNGSYEFSSESFYNNGIDEYNMITHYLDYFG
ncbi:MAG: transposase [Bacteroidota bacterium]|jgi:REP element-mobilizing transposase RayT